ncbi:uncharacterized protein EI90DRAFT_3139841 [Cantharellus anzutake]|uniref:uncharacterized protein n=1 Tax=Cantharellus anzutake TaxID=1750568 RepID=UPI0019080D68|nr:uncharacterized protein EI90DRAFT_3139841 [Cantharellus anzutake]KAF8310226.1 hypothetical protein EI90DRAFT_3139841 [Cantharellus anzutake]
MHPEDLRALMEGLRRQLVDGPEAEGEGQEAEAQEDFQEGDRYREAPKSAPTSKFHRVIAKKKRKTASLNREIPSAALEVAVLPPAIYVLSKQPPRSLNLAVKLTTLTSLATVSVSALLDSGATGNFVSPEFVRKHGLETTPLVTGMGSREPNLCHIRAYPTPTRLPDLHPLHLRSHNLPLPFRYSPSVLATHPSSYLSDPFSVRSDTHLGPNIALLATLPTTPLPPHHTSTLPSSPTLSPSVPISTFGPDYSSLPVPSLLPPSLLRHPSAKLRPSTAVPYFTLGHRSYLTPSLRHSPYLGL